MRLAIADPPYLGRADRWYGDGRGSGRVTNGTGRNGRKPDYHPQAAEWDEPERHERLVRDLACDFDGWAVAGTASSAPLLMSAAPAGTRLAVWVRPNAMPGGSRLICTWEPVVVYVPEGRRDRSSGMSVRDALVAPVLPQGFLGSKPPSWTRWVLDMLGYDPESDELTDVFEGSGAVAAAAGGMLALAGPIRPSSSLREDIP